MKVFKLIIVLLAFSVNFLHAAIPHKHHSSMSTLDDAKEHQSSQSVFDLISLVFHNDSGDENLSNIVQCELCNSLLDHPSDGLLYGTIYFSNVSDGCTQQHTPYQFVFNAQQFYSSLLQRGPPVK